MLVPVSAKLLNQRELTNNVDSLSHRVETRWTNRNAYVRILLGTTPIAKYLFTRKRASKTNPPAFPRWNFKEPHSGSVRQVGGREGK